MKNTVKGNDLGKALLMGTALVSLSSFQAEAASGTGTMSAIILTPIVISNQANLHFGSLTVDAVVPGTAVITAGGVRSQTGGVGLVTGLLEQAGVLRITAATNVTMDVALQAGPFTVDDAGLGAPMTVNAFNLKTDAGGTATTAIIPTTATFVDIPVGATLNVAAAQVEGTYTGTYTVDVNYQ